MYDIEQAILSVYDEFTIRELGIVSLGFFKTQTPIRSQELVHSLYKSLLNELLNIRSIELAAFLKVCKTKMPEFWLWCDCRKKGQLN